MAVGGLDSRCKRNHLLLLLLFLIQFLNIFFYTFVLLLLSLLHVHDAFLSYSEFPYDVTPDFALQHKAVCDRIKHSMQCLEDTTEYFLSAILQSVDKIP